MQKSVSPNLRTAQLICGALMGGVVAFWAVAIVITNGGASPFGADLAVDPVVLLAISIAISLGAFAAALLFRSRALAEQSGAAPQGAPSQASDMMTNLIVSWALLEGQALLAGVLFMLAGNPTVLIISALVFVLGFAITFPRSSWFEGVQETSAMRS